MERIISYGLTTGIPLALFISSLVKGLSGILGAPSKLEFHLLFVMGIGFGQDKGIEPLYIMAHTPKYFRPIAWIMDKVLWTPAVDGRFSVKSAWRVIRHPNPKVPWSVVHGFKGVCLGGSL